MNRRVRLTAGLGSMQAFAQEMPRMAIGKVLQRTEDFVARSKIQARTLEGECVEVSAVTALPESFGFRASQEACADPFAS